MMTYQGVKHDMSAKVSLISEYRAIFVQIFYRARDSRGEVKTAKSDIECEKSTNNLSVITF